MTQTIEQADLATMVYPADRYPPVIIARTPTTLTLAYLNIDNLPSSSRRESGWVVGHEFTSAEAATRIAERTVKAYRRWDGTLWIGGHTPLQLGKVYYYRNFAD